MTARFIVGIGGASGTGKTTLARAIAKNFNGSVATWDGVSAARHAAKILFGEPLPYLADTESKRDDLFFAITDLIGRAIDNHDSGVLILDRTPLDQLAYGIMHHTPAVFSGDVYASTLAACAAQFDVIFLATIARFHKIGKDPARKTQKAYHEVYERILEGVVGADFYAATGLEMLPLTMPGRAEAITMINGLLVAESIADGVFDV